MYRTLAEQTQMLAGNVSTLTDGSLDDYSPSLSPGPTPAAADPLSAAVAAVAKASGISDSGAYASARVLPPWLFPPPDSQAFDPVAAIATPAVGAGNTLVLTLIVPPGFDGVVRRLSHNYTGPGFPQGSGYIVWQLLLNGNAVRNYDAMTVEFGSAAWPRKIDGIRVKSGDVLQYFVNLPNGTGFVLPGNTNIICGMGGWLYPREGGGV